jgi:hypothetical protein
MSTLLEQASLVLIPSGYKEDTVYSVIPSNGSGDMSFTRASDGTRINSDGLVEVTPWNLSTYSEEFNDASWGKTNASVTANTTIAPNGTLTADTITSLTAAEARIIQTKNILALTVYSGSIFVKKDTNESRFPEFYLRTEGVSFNEIYVQLNTKTGASVIRSQNGTVSQSVESSGDYWRIKLTVTNTSDTTITFGIRPAITNIFGTYNPQIGSVIVWGAQLNIGSTAKPYFPTTDRLNVPRLTYQNGGGGCPSLLLEPQRTNLALYSEQFDNAYWPKLNSTITANSLTSPDGTVNADKLIADATTNLHRINISVFTGVALTSNTLSIFAKKGEYNFFYYRESISGTTVETFFDLNNGTITSIGAGRTATITSYGNGWYKCSVTATSVTANFGIGFGVAQTDGVSSFLGNGTSGIYLWGAQLEAGSYASSYIPTTSASATRIADACSKTSISSLIGQTEGVLFTDFVCNGFQDNGTALSVNNGTGSQFITIRILSNGNIRGWLYNGSTQAEITYTGGVVGQRYKLAFAYKTNDFAMYVNGSLVGTDVSGTTFSGTTLSRVDFDSANNASYILSLIQINQAILFKTRLTNSELATLTTI